MRMAEWPLCQSRGGSAEAGAGLASALLPPGCYGSGRERVNHELTPRERGFLWLPPQQLFPISTGPISLAGSRAAAAGQVWMPLTTLPSARTPLDRVVRGRGAARRGWGAVPCVSGPLWSLPLL